ncbi:hypothetical protein AK812_SmicGene15981 [Symbiodinium microadriaticum]|uniref:Uncharacterized protein n=1 Tax=Symbiodinium microadriaticum TaxID=2951 RepID=A0A1Q9E1I7_SYMMI|nr:hypothetical protein AK812_SmicGene15981 [Symbiodinium microadriaticum]
MLSLLLDCILSEFRLKAVIPGTPKDAKEGGLLVRNLGMSGLVFVMATPQGGYDYGVNAVRLNRIAQDVGTV